MKFVLSTATVFYGVRNYSAGDGVFPNEVEGSEEGLLEMVKNASDRIHKGSSDRKWRVERFRDIVACIADGYNVSYKQVDAMNMPRKFDDAERWMLAAALMGMQAAALKQKNLSDPTYGGFYDAAKAITMEVYGLEAFEVTMEGWDGNPSVDVFEKECREFVRENP